MRHSQKQVPWFTDTIDKLIGFRVGNLVQSLLVGYECQLCNACVFEKKRPSI